MLDIETLRLFLIDLRQNLGDEATRIRLADAIRSSVQQDEIRLAEVIRNRTQPDGAQPAEADPNSIPQDESLLKKLSLTQNELDRLPHH